MLTMPTIRITSREDLVAAVPYLLGFTPNDSLVCLTLNNSVIEFVARLDLPEYSQLPYLPVLAEPVAAAVAAYGSAAILVGYGPADRVQPAADLLTASLAGIFVQVRDALRVENGQYWCLLAGENSGSGVTFDSAPPAVVAEAVGQGIMPLPDRAAVEQLIAPVTGPRCEHVRVATRMAMLQLAEILVGNRTPDGNGQPPVGRNHLVHTGISSIQRAYEATSRGASLSDHELAWLTVLLLVPEVRDYASQASDGSLDHRQLWTDVTRRAVPSLTAAPAFLLAVTAYLGGDGIMANIAVDRALSSDERYGPAQVLARALAAGVHPSVWQAANTGTSTD